ncbi:hypothetical protein Q73_07570 [Bacillus coahuilensis m2-6]|uniref:SEC-C metal-binding domain-containing protein n=1 Tax=Bacillus coahuilensis TaxID=408580 RepID=UPI0007501182|nr:SEC-C metal-binding domain-containing protein [Bacillus coahuilensis]KUP08074.1 hypothetical protein Q73_07570 [Bacillus coahuilensis m2-6]
MPYIPAVCDNCSTIFSSGIFVENSSLELSGNKSGPCPNCGGMGQVPDGVFNFIGNTIEIISAPERSIYELRRFASLLARAYQEDLAEEQVEEQIAREVPSMSSILSLLPRNRTELRSDFYSWLQITVAIIAILSNLQSNGQEEVEINNIEINQKVEVNQVINQIYETDTNILDINSQQITIPKVGRNEPCPCGSGIKYKRCHGTN